MAIPKGGSTKRQPSCSSEDAESKNGNQPEDSKVRSSENQTDAPKPDYTTIPTSDEHTREHSEDQHTACLPWDGDGTSSAPMDNGAHISSSAGCPTDITSTIPNAGQDTEMLPGFHPDFENLATSPQNLSSEANLQTLTVADFPWIHPLQLPDLEQDMFPCESSAPRNSPAFKQVSAETIQLAQQIEDGCVSYLRKTSASSEKTTQAINFDSSAPHTSQRAMDARPDLLAEISKVGVYLMVRLGGHASYVYGTGANEVMEKVFRWRCCPSVQNRCAIPEPFRPTTLQTMSMNHPSGIDFINWPCIRDQVLSLH